MTIEYDENLIDEIAARFDLRDPNKQALAAVVQAMADSAGEFREMIADLATGVGKTFLMSALIEYMAQQGVRHVLVVTPGSTIQTKTLDNFDAASAKYVAGADITPFIVTPDNFRAAHVGAALRDPNQLKVFVFNVQQLTQPTEKTSRKVRADDENLGDALYTYLGGTGDLVVIADEHHVYHEKAKAFSAALRNLRPIALVGLTATPDPADYAKIVFQYTLGEAIADGHVKTPVIVYRKDGTKDEKTQLRDACQLLGHKRRSYTAYRETAAGCAEVEPVLFVVCQTIPHAEEVAQILAGPGFIGDPAAVLEITSASSDVALAALSNVEQPDSPIRAIVSVNMLREGWDVKNIAVIVALRRLASQTLTEQILGRGLRLPFGARTNVPDVDQVDLVAHDSYKQLLEQKDVLRQRIQLPATAIEVDETGAAVTTTVDPTQPVPPALGPDSGGAPEAPPMAPPLNQPKLFGLDDESADIDGDEGSPSILFEETEERIDSPDPKYAGRTDGAPQIVFPRRESRFDYAPFDLSDIPDGDAEKAGAAFIKDVPTFIFREELRAHRSGNDVTISRVPLANEAVQDTLTGIDTVRDDLAAAILQQPEVPKVKASKGAAKRLVRAFLRGAGVTSDDDAAEWGERRRQQAVEGMRGLIREAIANRKKEQRYELVPVKLPIEPVLVLGDTRHAYNDTYVRNKPFRGWRNCIMPIVSFDAKTTEWELAHLLDRDDAIAWWLRLYVHGPAFIRTPKDSSYYPDFIALDTEGTYWVIEGKADDSAQDDSVLRKKDAAEKWARAVRDDGEHGNWRYLFATESDIKQAAGSWVALLVTTKPE
jgi:type III restriction enzyme